VGSKDLGIEYIGEWVYGNRPTGILYAVQVRTLSQKNVQTNMIEFGPGDVQWLSTDLGLMRHDPTLAQYDGSGWSTVSAQGAAPQYVDDLAEGLDGNL
jgi:hypothetical protein